VGGGIGGRAPPAPRPLGGFAADGGCVVAGAAHGVPLVISTRFVIGGDGASASTGPGRTGETPEVPDDLVRAAISGDRTAVARLLATIRPLVVRYCRGRLGSADHTPFSADDVAQEVCLAVLTALPNYRPQGRPFLAFVYRIAANKLVDAHRAVSRARSEPVAEVPDSITSTAGPEQRALQGELSAQLHALLDELPDKQRRILVLRVVVGLSAEETGEIVGATPGAVRLAQHRASTRIRKIAVPGLQQACYSRSAFPVQPSRN
jgi:RNA polymerase sigma-70 factor, ECF subfamily